MILLLYGCNMLYEFSKFNFSRGSGSGFLILLSVLRSKFICFF